MLMLGATGEKIAESYEFYAVFMSEVEYRIVHETRTLGTYPIDAPVAPNETLIFAGRRWRIVSVDDDARVITVKSAPAGKPPYFTSPGGGIHDHIVEKMREILAGNENYFYLDEMAEQLLGAARTAFRDLGLHERSLLPSGDNVLIFPWVGTKRLKTLLLALLARQMNGTAAWHAIEILTAGCNGVRRHLEDIAADQNPDAMRLADHLAQPQLAKFDRILSPELMNLVTICERLDVPTLPSTAAKILAGWNHAI
jgi:ATP-dependent Lhr-like helicase